MRTVREDTKASDVFTEKLAAQRRKTEYGILGAVFPSTYKRDGRGIYVPGIGRVGANEDRKPREEVLVAEKRDAEGNITQREVRGTVGGKQTVVDRETTLKVLKEKGKSKKERAQEMLSEAFESEAKEKVKNESASGGEAPKPEKKPETA